MCGISGIFHRHGGGAPSSPDTRLLDAMASSMVHRGPDDSVVEIFGRTGFAFRRLSIVDLHGGRQPIANETGDMWVEGNGEIYNQREIRSELERRGHRFRTGSDIETILHGYEEWGLGILDRLNGIFGFAIWDQRMGRLVLARDHLGVKPLYWHNDGTTLRWGSEMRAVLADPSVPRQIDVDALRLFLHFGYLPAPHTLVAGVSKLRPGHLLVADDSGVVVQRYWNEPPTIREGIDDATAIEHYSSLFVDAVDRQMMSDVPVGVLLSGGVDSAMVLAAATRASDQKLKTFTIGFGGDFEYDEAEPAAETARLFGAEHHPITLDFSDFDGVFRETIDYLEEPVLSQSTFAYQRLTDVVADHVKVVLTGQGADEPLAGYDRYVGERYGRYARWLVGSTVANSIGESLGNRVPALEQIRRATSALGISDPTARFAAIHQVFSPADIAELGSPQLRASAARAEDLIDYWRKPVSHLDELNQLLYVDTRMSLPDDLLFYGDKLSMSNSVEARVPMLDRHLLDYIETLPSHLKLRGRTGKFVHKQAARSLLPDEVINRRKFGFATPIDAWFASDLGDAFEATVLSRDSHTGEHVDRGAMRSVLAEHRAGRRNHRRQLTALLSLELAATNLFSTNAASDVLDGPLSRMTA